MVILTLMGSGLGLHANGATATTAEPLVECLPPLPPPPGGAIPPGHINDLLRAAKDFYGVSMGTIQQMYNDGRLIINPTGTAVVVTSTPTGPINVTQTTYNICCSGGGAELTVVLGDL